MNIFFTILFILLATIFAFALALILLKIRFLIDTDESVFEVSQRPLYKVRALTDPENPAKLKIRVLGIPFVLDPLKLGRRMKKQKRSTPKKRFFKRFKNSRDKRKIEVVDAVRGLLNAVNIKYLHLSLDTGDYVHNAQIFPAAYILNRNLDERYSFYVNFDDENYLKTQIESRPIWFATAFLKLKINQNKARKNGT